MRSMKNLVETMVLKLRFESGTSDYEAEVITIL
jgi:hypothetical protein